VVDVWPWLNQFQDTVLTAYCPISICEGSKEFQEQRAVDLILYGKQM